jgi:hypothetical protein
MKLLVLVMLALATPAFADEPEWYRGVSKDKQKEAYDLFKQGNALFEENEYARAVELYQKALAVWDHPGIRFNLAVSLVNLDRVVEAHDQLEAAMRYGALGLETPQRFKEALTYKKLLEGRLVTFLVDAPQDGVTLTFDGKKIERNKKLIVMPGAHALVATKPGYEIITRNLTMLGGNAVERIEFTPKQRLTEIRRRYRTWVPWSLVIGGAAVGLVGGGAIALARDDRAEFESQFTVECPSGCTIGDPTKPVDWDLEDRARMKHRLGLVAVGVGGAVALTGLILVALNQPRVTEVPIAVTATASGGGVTWFGRF